MIQIIFNRNNLCRQIQLSGLRLTGKFSIELMTTDQLLGLQRQANVKWSKQGAVGAIKGVLGDIVKEGNEGGYGGAGATMIGCSAEQGGPNLIYLNQLILHAALNQKMRGEQVFFYKELVFLD